MKVELEPAYILHSRPYRESSLLIDFFTERHGRIHVIARGAKRKWQGYLQPFTALRISWSGVQSLKSLTQIEPQALIATLTYDWLYSGFYLNEILTRLLRIEDPHPKLFAYYVQALSDLAQKSSISPILRSFEKSCLIEIGYAVPLQQIFGAEKNYGYDPEDGFWEIDTTDDNHPYYFQGKHLLAINANNFQDTDVLQSAKRLFRLALKPHLGDRPLQSRQFFQKL